MNRRSFVKLISVGAAASVAGPVARAASAVTKKSVANTPVILECCINGSTTKSINPHAPETADEHTAEILRCLDAGATIVHTHSNQPNEDPKIAAEFYAESYRPVWKKHPHAILYATANFDPKVYGRVQDRVRMLLPDRPTTTTTTQSAATDHSRAISW